ncbi:MAG TPA: BadF/BadG/BcrA/BcrD ATPase family protein [Candidatus Acidoferrum sp.]|nr:BadF/BadG/BcrA/BcrD ATPase family protein [Candidatus Acidoferrum sp.]
MRIGMGLDGGGTKTDCVLMDDAGRIVGCGRGAASNPSRIGVDAAAKGVIEAATAALRDAKLGMAQVSDVCAGLAGVALAERAAAMRALLAEFFHAARFELCTDLDLALSAAGTAPAIVLVAGTGSAAIGRDTSGRVVRSGGYGPKQSDEGSAFAIGKRAIHDLGRALNGAPQELQQKILAQLAASSLESVTALAGAEADAVYPRVFPIIAREADAGNEIAQGLLRDAALCLASFVSDVQTQLHLAATEFVLGKTGGMIGRSQFLDKTLDAELRRAAPQSKLRVLQTPLAEVAARRALNL